MVDDRRYSVNVIYSGSGEDSDFRNNRIDRDGRVVKQHQQCVSLQYFHILLRELRIYLRTELDVM